MLALVGFVLKLFFCGTGFQDFSRARPGGQEVQFNQKEVNQFHEVYRPQMVDVLAELGAGFLGFWLCSSMN